MFEKVKVKNGIYPLLSLFFSVIILFSGLLIVNGAWIVHFFILLSLIYVFFGYGKTMFVILVVFIPLSLSAGLITFITSDMQDSLSNLWRVLLLGMAAVLTLSIDSADLVRNLNQIRVPRFITTGILISLRFIPVLAEEFRRIRLAMKLRGINTGFYRPSILYRAFFIPLVMRLMSISDTLTVSLETRAFTMKNEATSYKIISLRPKDIIFSFWVSVLVTAVLFMTFK